MIFQLRRSKITWDNYVLLQMMSKYFSACDRPLKCVKSRVSVEFEHTRHDSNADKTLGTSLLYP